MMNRTNDLIRCINSAQCRAIHINDQVPLNWALPLYGYVMPVIVSITLVTNSFIVVVLSHKTLRTPTNYVLLAMAVTELLTGLFCFPWLLYYYTLHGYATDLRFGLPAFWCQMFPYMAFILPSMFHTAAIWLTVFLAVQRYIYICVPKLVQGYCTLKKSKQAIMVIFISAVSIYMPDTLATYNRSVPALNTHGNVTIRYCIRMRTKLLITVGNDIYYYSVYCVHTLLVHTLPCILLVVFTWKLISAIRTADRRHTILMTSSYTEFPSGNRLVTCPSQRSKRSDSEVMQTNNLKESLHLITRINRSQSGSAPETKRVQYLKQNTRMLIVVIILFLITEIPAAVIFATHVGVVGFRARAMLKYYEVFNALLIIRNVLIVTSYPFRFAIYCGMSTQFRDVARQLITRWTLCWLNYKYDTDTSSKLFKLKRISNADREASSDQKWTQIL